MSKAKTPGSIIAASVIMFIYGGLLLMCGVCGGAAVAFQPQDDAMGLKAALEKEAPGYTIVSYATPVGNLIFGILFVASGAGVLRLVAFCRATAYLACAGILSTTIAASVYNAIFVLPLQQRVIMQQLQNPNNPPMPGNMNTIMAFSTAFGLLIVIAIHFAFCLPPVILLNVKSAREAFAGVLPEPDDDDAYAIRRRPRRDEDDGDEDDDYGPSKKPRAPGDTGITDRGQ